MPSWKWYATPPLLIAGMILAALTGWGVVALGVIAAVVVANGIEEGEDGGKN